MGGGSLDWNISDDGVGDVTIHLSSPDLEEGTRLRFAAGEVPAIPFLIGNTGAELSEESFAGIMMDLIRAQQSRAAGDHIAPPAAPGRTGGGCGLSGKGVGLRTGDALGHQNALPSAT